jgi:hypothetical protein
VALMALIRDGEFDPHKLGDMLIPMVQKGLAA